MGAEPYLVVNCGDGSLREERDWVEYCARHLLVGDTFSGGNHTGVRVLDVSATLDSVSHRVALFVVNRSLEPAETEIVLQTGRFTGSTQAYVVNGPDIKAHNRFEQPDVVITRQANLPANGSSPVYAFEPHSVTALVFTVR
ncbi:MAG TPA: hypothetical protein EYP04_11410 [Anaerolineae bacterium]|nr:hypothetical protein [Anaerolineae bacterium]